MKKILTILAAVLLLLTACGTDAKKEQWQSCQPGDILTFGKYEQDNDLKNGPEDIEWLVLDREGSRVLVISKYILEVGSHATFEFRQDKDYWAVSDLRTWLNGDFFQTAFTPKEQEWIPMTTLENPVAETWEWSIGKEETPTEDRVFLLSTPEVENWFPDQESRVAEPTAWVKAQGVSKWWWLRTTGYKPHLCSLVATDGKIVDAGLTQQTYGIRPAMWVDCEFSAEQTQGG